ncbi:TPA: phosphoenolpyruvate synthase, partial [Candidatus Micrarchaeota archaeon]|nr:phosphoenolpyruvate synthase [Candidatus Micrarchaeota archaeon]
ELIMSSPMPSSLSSSIVSAYETLCSECETPRVPVAVRSSATAEDLPTASFAGQQETYLWIQGAEQVCEKVQRCWASLFTPRAISYRVKNGFSHHKVLISVGVQKMVNSKAAGVMFTLNPIDGDLSKVVIEAAWGLGETVVSGSVNPDKFVVDKVLMETTEKTISEKHIQCIYDSSTQGVAEVEVPEKLQNRCCLEEREIRELVSLARKIEDHYGIPMDIEWSIDKEIAFPRNVFIVQARPETVWTQKKRKPVIGGKSGRQLLMEQAMKRIKLH